MDLFQILRQLAADYEMSRMNRIRNPDMQAAQQMATESNLPYAAGMAGAPQNPRGQTLDPALIKRLLPLLQLYGDIFPGMGGGLLKALKGGSSALFGEERPSSTPEPEGPPPQEEVRI